MKTLINSLVKVAASSFLAFGAMASLAGVAEASSWVPCGVNGGDCAIPSVITAPVTVRYGSDTTGYFYSAVQGVTSFPCRPDQVGDPDIGNANKKCAFSTDTKLIPTSREGGSYSCAEHSSLNCFSNTMVPVHYGVGNKWYTTFQSGWFSCSNAHFAFDPAPGQVKSCLVMPNAGVAFQPQEGPLSSAGSKLCASQEGLQCDMPNIARYYGGIVRYGTDGAWTYRVTDIGGSLPCSLQTFNKDPAKNIVKRCEQFLLAPMSKTLGEWEIVQSCNHCEMISSEITFGTEHSESSMTTQEWGTAVTVGMQAGLEFEGIGGVSVSTEVSSTYSQSVGFTEALTSTFSDTSIVQCGDGVTKKNRVMYRFLTSTDSDCLSHGKCGGSTWTAKTHCVENPYPGYLGPECLPGYCNAADPYCLKDKCTY